MKELIFLRNNQPVTSSRKIAGKFNKRHGNILRDVENLECSQNFNELNFELVNYLDNKGEKRPEYLITRDGFTFLVMGFTGKQAALFKEEYIAAFNKMEKQLKSPHIPTPLEQARQVVQLLERQAQLLPKAQYYDTVLSSPDTVNTTTIAKELGMSAIKLNRLLHANGVQYKQDGHWVLYSKHQSKGYTKTYTKTYQRSNGEIGTKHWTEWTETGRRFIHQLLNPTQTIQL